MMDTIFSQLAKNRVTLPIIENEFVETHPYRVEPSLFHELADAFEFVPSPLPVVPAPPVSVTSTYQTFIKATIADMKATNPDMDGKARMKLAIEKWHQQKKN